MRRGPKRPPVAVGVRADGTGVLRFAGGPGHPTATPGGWRRWPPASTVEEVAVAGPPTSADLRAAGWAEAAVVLAGLGALRAGTVGPGTRSR